MAMSTLSREQRKVATETLGVILSMITQLEPEQAEVIKASLLDIALLETEKEKLEWLEEVYNASLDVWTFEGVVADPYNEKEILNCLWQDNQLENAVSFFLRQNTLSFP